MTHESEHVVVSLATPLDSRKEKGWKCWHVAAILLAIGFCAGLLF